MRIFRSLVSAFIAYTVAISLVSAQDQTIVEIATSDSESFSTLVTALQAAAPAVLETLQGDGPFTVFAPTNDAFDNLPNGALDYLLANQDILTEVLLYHVVEAEVFSDQISNRQTAETLGGESVSFHLWWTWSWRGGWMQHLFVNESQVITKDVDASNGVVHVIDKVLIPPSVTIPQDIVDTAVSAGDFNLLVAALVITGLDSALAAPNGPFTVLAPTDEAFLNLPPGAIRFLLKDSSRTLLTEILQYHVASGEVRAANIIDGSVTTVDSLLGNPLDFSVVDNQVEINNGDATVVIADVIASNGVIHAIDEVLLTDALAEQIPLNIVDTANEAGSFSTLIAALEATGLDEVLKGAGPFTVLAPTNEAFAKLPEGKLDELLEDPDTLADILKYHVILGEKDAEDVIALDGRSLHTINFKTIDVAVGDSVVLNGASTVTDTDVFALNGVIHIIDTVLELPEEEEEECPYNWNFLCWLLGYN